MSPFITIYEKIASPSHQILADGKAILTGIKNNNVYQWTSNNWFSSSQTGTSTLVNNSITADASLLRLDPDNNTLNLWVIDSGGSTHLLTSLDGGATWSTPTTISSLPNARKERGDARYIGDRWIRIYGDTAGGLKQYESRDGINWTPSPTVIGGTPYTDGTVSSAGMHGFLVPYYDGEFTLLYWDGSSNLVSSLGTCDNTGTWTWANPVTIVASNETSPVGFITGTKIVMAYRQEKNSLGYYVSFDRGATWSTGAFG